ncbi:prepronociceptin b [Polymixia lowei]
MKTPLWCLAVLMACVFTPGRGDCQGECLACGLLLQQEQLQQAFNTMVCLLECEGHVSSSFIWDLCKRAIKLPQYHSSPEGGALSKRTGEELQLTPFDLDSNGELLRPAGMQHYQDAGLRGEGPFKQHSAQYDSLLLGSSEEGESLEGLELGLGDGEREEREEREATRDGQLEAGGGEDSEAIDLSKRFGGFMRGRHGYRKLIGSPARLQKRYGGFIGIRKSARKWNSQKRVNQLLRQYLGMRSSRSGRFNGFPATENPTPVTSANHVVSSSLQFEL